MYRISNGVETTNSQSISTLFNTFFTSIGNALADAIKQRLPKNIFVHNQIRQFHSTLEFKEIKIESVFKQLSSLKTNKSIGLDGISARLLKAWARLTKIVCLPKDLERGKETPIYKSGDRSNISNYRRITVLPILSKILERLVHTQIHSYLSESKILSQYQLALDLSCLPVPHLHSSLTPFLIMLITVLS